MIGQTISHYRVLAKVGQGGMGLVYRAEDLTLERTVALKFLSTGALAHPESKARFLREARAAAGLDHPNVCTVYEAGEIDGQAYIAMAYLRGRTVREVCAEGPAPLPVALDIAIQTGEGLQAAHDQGIVHRDIKGANLMVTPDGRVKIMDFGLAQLVERARFDDAATAEFASPGEETRTLDATAPDITRLTRTGTTLGTPAYMSPEQALRKRTDHRTDIWSLGVVLYEMLTGTLPFVGRQRDPHSVLNAILHEDPSPVTMLRTDAPAELDRIVGKALAKDPSDRYRQTREMLDDSLAEALAASAFLKGYYEWKWDEAFQAIERALRINPSLAIAHYHHSWLSILFGRMREAIASHERARQLDPLMPLHTVWLGMLYSWNGEHERGIAEVRKTLETNPGYPFSHHVLAMIHRAQGHYDQAIAEHQKSVKISPMFKGPLGCTYADAGRIVEARRLLDELESLEPSPWRAFWLANLHTLLGDFDEAFRWLKYERHHAWVAWVRVLPEFAALRSDRRLPGLLRQMNLTPFDGFDTKHKRLV